MVRVDMGLPRVHLEVVDMGLPPVHLEVVDMGLPPVRREVVDTDPHRALLIIMGERLASLAVLEDLVVLLVHLRSGSQVGIPMAHHLVRRVSRVRLEVGLLSRMVEVVDGELWC
jgi:hypothetical protein